MMVMGSFRLLIIRDVVGEGGCAAVQALVPGLRRELGLDAVIANGENSAGGLGITADTGEALLSVADFLTLGDHAFDRQGVGDFLDREQRIVRPANLDAGRPQGAGGAYLRQPGSGSALRTSRAGYSCGPRTPPSRPQTGL